MRTLALLSLLAAALSADTLTLKNGRVMNGTYLGGAAREVRMDMGDHVETIPVDRISTLQFDDSAPVPAPRAAALSADILTLKNGSMMNGTYLGGTAREVRLDMGDHVETVPAERISALQFGNSAPPTAPAPQAQAAPPAQTPSNFDRFGTPPANSTPGQELPPPDKSNAAVSSPPNNAPPPPANPAIVIPQGTPLTVRMIDSVDSQKAQLGDQFRASIEDPVVINGQTVIPRGADVSVRLVSDQQSGKISGKTVLTLAITTVTVNGKPIDVTTGDVQQASGSRGARSAKVIGGATVLGAIIGAAAGGGRGAAIGAGSGAAVGTGAEVATKGQRVKIPSEARLTFTLSNDITI